MASPVLPLTASGTQKDTWYATGPIPKSINSNKRNSAISINLNDFRKKESNYHKNAK